MRLRKVKNALDKLKANQKYFIENPQDYKGKWQSVFGNNNPIHIEIGCGKGQFISTLATLNPNINYLAIEKYDSVLLRCLEKVENLKQAIIKSKDFEPKKYKPNNEKMLKTIENFIDNI